jgi:NAD(P)-dependent dehydrogenase (short-subunit alcohol dehydrogenase family)
METDLLTPDPLAAFRIDGKIAVVTGGSGVLGTGMARALSRAGARVALLARGREALDRAVDQIAAEGGEVIAVPADVLVEDDLRQAARRIQERWGPPDILVNAAGGTSPGSSVPAEGSFFDLAPEALRQAVDLNLMGTMLPCAVFGPGMASRSSGSIVNISSMTASRPLTRVVAYAAAKAGIENFTRWLAVDLARRFGPDLRVNAIAPGFLLSAQNRHLLVDESGDLTARGKAIIEHTPAGRFGDPGDLMGTLIWLCSPAAAFVTGTVIPVDGGFSAWWGV